jgi:hypothetical protein
MASTITGRIFFAGSIDVPSDYVTVSTIYERTKTWQS